MDSVSEHISEAIIRHWRDQGIGIKELARRLDLSVTSLGDALRMNRPFSLPEAQQKMLELLEKADRGNMDFWRSILL